jgi:hypothetical protein
MLTNVDLSNVDRARAHVSPLSLAVLIKEAVDRIYSLLRIP